MKTPTIKEIASLIKFLKTTIADDYRAYDDDDDDLPSMQLTIGCNTATGEWSYQTGDNSYSGGAYLYPTWAVVAIYRRSNSRELAREIVAQLHENAWQS
jgi:hypothetical protein